MICSVPERGADTEYPFRTGNACFLHRMPQKMRRVPQEPVFYTECVFRTVEGPLRYRMPQTAERRRALPAASITNTKKEKVLPAANATTARKEEANAKSAARLIGENKKRTTSKSFSFQFGVRYCSIFEQVHRRFKQDMGVEVFYTRHNQSVFCKDIKTEG